MLTKQESKEYKAQKAALVTQILSRAVATKEDELSNLLEKRLRVLDRTRNSEGASELDKTNARKDLEKNMDRCKLYIVQGRRNATEVFIQRLDRLWARYYNQEMNQKKIDLEEIWNLTEDYFKYGRKEVVQKSRKDEYVNVRRIMFVVLHGLGMTLEEAANNLGRKHCSTIYNRKMFFNICETDKFQRMVYAGYLIEISRLGYTLPYSIFRVKDGQYYVGGRVSQLPKNYSPMNIDVTFKIREIR